jgi:hypothetical protein
MELVMVMEFVIVNHLQVDYASHLFLVLVMVNAWASVKHIVLVVVRVKLIVKVALLRTVEGTIVVNGNVQEITGTIIVILRTFNHVFNSKNVKIE